MKAAEEPTGNTKPLTTETRLPNTKNQTRVQDSTTSRPRRQSGVGEMTSAFILPDITLHGAAAMVEEKVKLSPSAQRALDEVSQHDRNNCGVCKNAAKCSCNPEKSNDRHSVNVPKPVPVSDRMPKPTAYNEEPTMRPSQPPALALASVLKALEDELSHLKMQLALFQTAYNKHDASLSKRQRKSLHRKIERVMRDAETKSDQIYALYDVLEGQKQNGEDMTEEQVEVTLQSIGIPTGVEEPENTRQSGTKGKLNLGDDESESDDEDLPWEGIESTTELTGRSLPSKKGTMR